MILSEEAKLVLLGLIVAVVVAGSAFTVTKLLAAGADHEKAAVAAATLAAQHSSDLQSATWQARAVAAETSQGAEHAAIDQLRGAVGSLGVSIGANRPVQVPGAARPAASTGAATAPVVRQVVVCEASEDLRSDYRSALDADALAADFRSLYDAWPSLAAPPPR